MMQWFKRKLRILHDLWKLGGWYSLSRTLQRKLFPSDMWSTYSEEAAALAPHLDFSSADIKASEELQRTCPDPLAIRSVTWFIPDFSHPYYGGIHTILRCADYLKTQKGVVSQFALIGSSDERKILALITRAFPSLAESEVRRVERYGELERLAATDAGVATLFSTAYFLLRFSQTRRKFYFVQDYEPLFYPAGSIYALIEATYRFGFYGIANTPSLKTMYETYGGAAQFFVPCVDTHLFHPPLREHAAGPYKVFFYGRPQHPRNGFELGVIALKKLKERLGDQVQLVSAGAVWKPLHYGLKGIVENLGLLSYEQTTELYRSCHAGLVMMFTRHPSYLPFELMASGCLVVSNRNPATSWLLKDGQNCLLSEPSACSLAEALEKALLDEPARRRITTQAVQEIQKHYSDWNEEFEKVYRYMCDPGLDRG
jgi:O-antigen biosynthesis protein